MKTIEEILNHVSSPTIQGRRLVLFDLDSTLFCVSHRTQKILRDFADQKEHQNQFPKECLQLSQIETTQADWGIRQALDRAGIRSTASFFFELRKYWTQHFFSNHYLYVDQPYEGAVDYVHRVKKGGHQIT